MVAGQFIDPIGAHIKLAHWVAVFLAVVVLCGVALAFPGDWTWHDQQRVVQVFLLICVGIWTSLRPGIVHMVGGLPRRALWATGTFFALGLLSALFADVLRYALLEWSTFWLSGLVAITIEQAWFRDAPFVEKAALLVLAALGGIVVLKTVVGYAAIVIEVGRLDTFVLFDGMFSNRRFFGQLATLVIPLLAWAAWTSRRYTVTWFALLAAWWMLLFASGTRGSWVALAIAHGLVLVWVGRRAWGWGRLAGGAVLAGLLAYGLLFYVVPHWFEIEAVVENRFSSLATLTTLSGREVIWGLAMRLTMEHPLLGVGPMHFAAYPNAVAAHPHNAVLQLAAEWGVPATLAAAFLAAVGLWAFVRPLRTECNPLRLALAVSLLGAAIQSLVDGVLVIPYTQTWLAVVTGLALGVHFQDRGVPAPGKSVVWVVRGATTLAVVALLYGIVPDVLNREEATSSYFETHNWLAPRYWAQGWIR